MEAANFKKGDRVILTRDHPDDNEDLVAGCTGTVMTVYAQDYGDEDIWCGVWWDNKIERGHTLDDESAPDGYGWNVPQEFLNRDRDIDDDIIAGEDELFAFIGIE